jgi:hypothetical protein
MAGNNMHIGPPSNSHGMQKSSSLPNFTKAQSPNSIPTKKPSSGFRPSFLASDAPMSAREIHEAQFQHPNAYPKQYSDNNLLGMSSAKIAEMLNNQSKGGFSNPAYINPDIKVQGRTSSSHESN